MTENASDSNKNAERRDVQPGASHVLGWNPEHRRESVHAVYLRAEKHALEAIDWYLLSKRQKKFWAQQLRLDRLGWAFAHHQCDLSILIAGLSFRCIGIGGRAFSHRQVFRLFFCMDTFYRRRASDPAKSARIPNGL